MITSIFWIIPLASVLALAFAWFFFRQMMKESEGTELMKKIASFVREGAMSYLKQQYKVVASVFVVLVILFSIMAYGFHVQNEWVPIAFLTGGFFSGLAGFLGMKTATYASARTANAARTSLNKGLQVAFRSGAVMGLVVVGLGLLDISFWYILLNAFIPDEALDPTHKLTIITTTMLTFGMGASTQALFARVGGGIYTKAADVGADLVGKVEAGIPEDDPRNPATIADNVGDNVGDVAGMGADLYESYCGSILATAALGAAAFVSSGSVELQYKAVVAPMLIAAVGIILSIIGIFAVRTNENATIKQLLKALAIGTNLSSVLIAISTFGILYVLGMENWFWIGCSVIVGLLVGIVIGQATRSEPVSSIRWSRRQGPSPKKRSPASSQSITRKAGFMVSPHSGSRARRRRPRQSVTGSSSSGPYTAARAACSTAGGSVLGCSTAATPPPCNTTSISQLSSASAGSCRQTSAVLPPVWTSCASSAVIRLRFARSSALSGSSSKSSGASSAIVRARIQSCFSPPLSVR